MSTLTIAAERIKVAGIPADCRLGQRITRSGDVETRSSSTLDTNTEEVETTGLLFAALIGGSLKSRKDESGRARLTLCEPDRGRSGRSLHSRCLGVPLWRGSTPDPESSCQPTIAHGATSPHANRAGGESLELSTRTLSASTEPTYSRSAASHYHQGQSRSKNVSRKSGWLTGSSAPITPGYQTAGVARPGDRGGNDMSTQPTRDVYAEGDRVKPTRGYFKDWTATIVRIARGGIGGTRYGLLFDRDPRRPYFYGEHELTEVTHA